MSRHGPQPFGCGVAGSCEGVNKSLRKVISSSFSFSSKIINCPVGKARRFIFGRCWWVIILCALCFHGYTVSQVRGCI